MRIITFLIFSLISSASVHSTEKHLAWELIQEGESSAKEWVNSLTENELLALGTMNQQPEELELVRAFYPYLLPEGFFNRNVELTCYPSFLAFSNTKALEAFNNWKQCVGELWRDVPPRMVGHALKDLEP